MKGTRHNAKKKNRKKTFFFAFARKIKFDAEKIRKSFS